MTYEIDEWVAARAACRDIDQLFADLKERVAKDVAAANELIREAFALEQTIPKRFVVTASSWFGRNRWTTFDLEDSSIEVGIDNSPEDGTRFTVGLFWEEDTRCCHIRIVEGRDTKQQFPATELWRVSEKALSWLFFARR